MLATKIGIPSRGVSDRTAWRAVLARDSSLDGALVYAVRSTGIYCRPSCPSRRPKRRHVVFYRGPEQAESGGFRPCRRCRPNASVASEAEGRIERARRYLDEHTDEVVTLEQLAEVAGVSSFHLQRRFKAVLGLSPKAYQDRRRIEAFKARIKAGDSVGLATYEAGFGSSRALYTKAKAALGMTPGVYKRGGQGLRIRFTILASRVGRLLVAVTERGICAVSLGDDEPKLEQALRDEFPKATISRDDSEIRGWAKAVLAGLDGTREKPRLVLDLQGTDFQRRVWQALQQIPYGQTRSYTEIAQVIGATAGRRAVARACASNKTALVVPCHRVVRQDGSLSGYRWGIERKRKLLEHERRRRGQAGGRP